VHKLQLRAEREHAKFSVIPALIGGRVERELKIVEEKILPILERSPVPVCRPTVLHSGAATHQRGPAAPFRGGISGWRGVSVGRFPKTATEPPAVPGAQ
jgi:hypothetical protein